MDKFFKKKIPSKQKRNSLPPDLTTVTKSIEETHKVIQEIHQIENNIQDIRKKIEDKLEVSNDQLREYISNPTNFTPEQWSALQKQSRAVKEKIKSSDLLKYYRKGNVLDDFLREGDDESNLRKRKGKIAGTRRKWIPMP